MLKKIKLWQVHLLMQPLTQNCGIRKFRRNYMFTARKYFNVNIGCLKRKNI